MRVRVSWSRVLFGFVFQAWKVEEATPPNRARDCSSLSSHFLRRFMNALIAAEESSARSEALPRSAPDSKSYPAILGRAKVAAAAAIAHLAFENYYARIRDANATGVCDESLCGECTPSIHVTPSVGR